MQESELREYQRLRAEGRWPEANEFRETERRRLRAAGRNRQEAKDESWSLMLAEFPAIGEVGIGDGADFEDIATLVPSGFIDNVDDTRTSNPREVVMWVFQNAFLSWHLIDASTAPNRGAVGLLARVKSAPSAYGELLRMWAKFMPTKTESDSEPRFTDDGRRRLVLLEEFEARLAAEYAAWQSR